MTKVFIVSLPRTGTTSTCVFLLNQGYRVAHTAFSANTFEQADVIADTPVFADYKELLEQYPSAKLIYLQRPLSDWLKSIKRLLTSMRKHWRREGSLFHNDIERCFNLCFPGFLTRKNLDDSYLQDCLLEHKERLLAHASKLGKQALVLDITHPKAGIDILNFLGKKADTNTRYTLPHVNKQRRIRYWDDIDHKNKVFSR